jgi:hypothetical protein
MLRTEGRLEAVVDVFILVETSYFFAALGL